MSSAADLYQFLYLCRPENKTEELKALLDKGVNINGKDPEGNFALSVAIKCLNLKHTKFLVRNGADINKINKSGWKPIHIASWSNFKEGVKYLLELGVDINCKTKTNATPLHIACLYGRTNMVEFLILNGADYNAEDRNCVTPLQIAALTSGRPPHTSVYDILAGFGAVVNSKAPIFDPNLWWQRKIFIDSYGVKLLFKSGYDITRARKLQIKGNYYKDNCPDIYNEIHKRIIQIKAAEPCLGTISPSMLNQLNNLSNINTDEIMIYEKECTEEINAMKSKKFATSKISFYDFLASKNIYQLALYLQNEYVISEFSIYKNSFPIYYDMIETKFKQAHVRFLLSNLTSKYLIYLSKYKLTSLPNNIIISYLTNKDMENFLDAFSVKDPKNIPRF